MDLKILSYSDTLFGDDRYFDPVHIITINLSSINPMHFLKPTHNLTRFTVR